jgi:D-psicose/D-tagatose/L-ribulose 3-epimerase
MKLAASNIAWQPAEDDEIAGILRARGFTGIEIAPSKRWSSPFDATTKEVEAYRDSWDRRGLPIVAMQSLLFGRPDLQLFGLPAVRASLRDYLVTLIDIAGGLGARALVFGSPRNRTRGLMPLDEATGIAVDFFREIGAAAASRGCLICLEPCPPAYDCDFINTTHDAVALCERIAHPGVRVNGDASTIALNGEDAPTAISAAAPWLGHFHASEPSLVEVSDGPVQRACATALGLQAYEHWVSIEMRAPGGTSSVEPIARAADFVARTYGGPARS